MHQDRSPSRSSSPRTGSAGTASVRQVAEKQWRCEVCAEYCLLRDGEMGRCGVRQCRKGRLQTLGHGGIARVWTAAIESLGFYHVLPNSRTLCVAAGEGRPRVGVDFEGLADCSVQAELGPARFPICSANGLASQVDPSECGSVLFTQVEPTFFPEIVSTVLSAVRRRGLLGLIQTHGTLSVENLKWLAPVVDGVSLLVPTLREPTAKRLGGVLPHRVREVLQGFFERGVWVEVTTALFPGVNDTDAEILEIAHSIASVHPSIPWHLRRAGGDLDGESQVLTEAPLELARSAGLRNVYAANALLRDQEITFCHRCGDEVLIERFLGRVSNFLRDGDLCPRCRNRAHGLFRGRELMLNS